MSLVGGKVLAAKLKEIAKKASGKKVSAGFLSGSVYEDGTPAAQVAFWNEYGTSGGIDVEGGGFHKHTPPRPFFRQTIAEHSKDWGKESGQLLKANDYDLDMTLNQMGRRIRDQIEDKIITFSDPRNADSTIEKKGFDAPLRHTNQLHTKFLDFEVTPNESS